MNRITLIVIIIFAFLSPLFAWERIYSGPYNVGLNKITSAWDGGYISSGTWAFSLSSGNRDVLLMKIDECGDTVWNKTYGDPFFYEGHGRHVATSDSAYAIVFSEHFPYHYPCLLKVDVFGDTIWSKKYFTSEDAAPFDFSKTYDGGFIITGWINASPLLLNADDVLLIRTDSEGDTVWVRAYGGDNTNIGYDIHQTADGDFLVCGQSSNSTSPPDTDVYILKVSQTGDSLWAKTYDFGGSIAITRSFVFTGGDTAVLIGLARVDSSDYSDLLIMCIDEVGNMLWYNTYGGPSYDVGDCIRRTDDGGFIVVGGSFSTLTMSYDIWLLKFDSSGDTVWTRKFGEDSDKHENGNDIISTLDGGYIIAGSRVYPSIDNEDPYIIKVDSLGYSAIEESPGSEWLKPFAYGISAYPNPFNSSVTITLSVIPGLTRNPEIEIFDINGRIVFETPVGEGHRALPSGGDAENGSTRRCSPTNIVWTPDESLGSGVYLLRAKIGDESVTKRVVYLK